MGKVVEVLKIKFESLEGTKVKHVQRMVENIMKRWTQLYEIQPDDMKSGFLNWFALSPFC
jgi:hypothetical protein